MIRIRMHGVSKKYSSTNIMRWIAKCDVYQLTGDSSGSASIKQFLEIRAEIYEKQLFIFKTAINTIGYPCNYNLQGQCIFDVLI